MVYDAMILKDCCISYKLKIIFIDNILDHGPMDGSTNLEPQQLHVLDDICQIRL